MPASIRDRQRQITAEIAKLGPCLPGSLVERMTRCGSERCRCHADPAHRHGPYPSWIRSVDNRTVTRTLSREQAERYRPMFDNTRRLRELVSQLESLGTELVDEDDTLVSPQSRRRGQ